MSPTTKKGLVLSFLTMFFWALHDVSFRYTAINYKVDPTVFICFTLFVASFVLILVAGAGKGGFSTLKRGHTWLYGFLEVAMNIAQMFALLYITTTEMNFLNRATVVITIFATWLFFKRKPHLSDVIGGSLVVIGLYIISSHLDDAIKWQALFSILIVALTSVATAMIGEVHPENNEAETVRDRARVAGFVLLVSTFMFLLFAFIMAILNANIEGSANLAIINLMPTIDDFTYKPTFFIALILGSSVIPIAMYFFFYATKTAKTETFMAVSSTLPFITYAVEFIASKFVALDISAISHTDLFAGLLIVIGAFLIEFMRKRKSRAAIS